MLFQVVLRSARTFRHRTQSHLINSSLNFFQSQRLCSSVVQPNGSLKNDIDTISEVESNLFENSEKSHKPVQASSIHGKYKETFKQTRRKDIKVNPKRKYKTAPLAIEDTELGLKYMKLELKDSLLSELLLTMGSRKKRDKCKQILIEGRRLILEALNCGLTMQTLLFSRKEQLALIKDEISHLKDLQIVKVTHHNLKLWSALTASPGLLAIFNRPNNVMRKADTFSLPISVVCDNIREPNNLGSIIRTCAAIPCTQVLVLKGCCDPWESKALRGGCGGQFRITIKDEIEWINIEKNLPEEFSVFIAENNLSKLHNSGKSFIQYNKLSIPDKHSVLIIGGETHGISDDAYNFLQNNKYGGGCVYIPLAEGIESLNTASAVSIILFQMKACLEKLNGDVT